MARNCVRRVDENLVRIEDPEAFVLPERCLVCEETEVTWVKYKQYQAPFATPVVAVARWVNVSMPYCRRHAARLATRLFWLRASQLLAIGLFFATPYVGMRLRISDDYIWMVFVIPGLIALIWLVVSLYVIRPRIYDAVYFFKSRTVYLQAKSAAFIDAVVEENYRG